MSRPDDTSRRALLRAGGAALLASTAGCTTALPPVGPAREFGRVDAPPADPPRYRRALPAPGAVDGLAGEGYAAHYRRPSALDYSAPIRFLVPRKRVLADLDAFGVGYADADELLHTDLGTVVYADFDRREVARSLAESGYAPAGVHRSYDRFAREDVPRRAAVGDGVLVWTSDRVHDLPRLELLADAEAGRVARYHEEHEAVADLTDRIGESRMVELIPPVRGARDWTSVEAFRFDGETAFHVRAFAYPSADAVPEDRLRRRSVRRETVLTREVDGADVRVDGRVVTFEGRIPPRAGVAPADVDPPYPPQVTWGLDRAADAVTVRHEAGDPVPGDALRVEFTRGPDADGLVYDDPRPLFAAGETVTPGTTATLDVADPPTVRLGDPDGPVRPATRAVLTYAPGDVGRPVFAFDLPTGESS